jgi:MFS family permease
MEATGSKGINKQQKKTFIAAWLGWAFDGLDGFMYGLIALPFVSELVHHAKGIPADAETKTKAAIIQAVFLLGWALGGAVFGRIGDKIGRTKTLTITILFYACFTGLAAISTEWWHLLIFRFLAALGIGGEWAAGAALVSETLDKKYRHYGGAILQSGYMAGMLMAALATKLIAEPRMVFIVGVLPAFATLWIRKAVPEPEEWSGAKEREATPPISALFGPKVIKTTLKVLVMSAITLCGAWTILFFTPQLFQTHPSNKGMSPAEMKDMVFWVTIMYTCWNIVGNLFSAFMTKWLGYRKGFAILLTCALLVFVIGFSVPRSSDEYKIWVTAAAFFGLGVFGSFPLYFPLLFPTLLRTTGAGFCYNAGRVITAVGTLFAGQLPDPRQIFLYAGFLYIIVIALAFTMPEVDQSKEELVAT